MMDVGVFNRHVEIGDRIRARLLEFYKQAQEPLAMLQKTFGDGRVTYNPPNRFGEVVIEYAPDLCFKSNLGFTCGTNTQVSLVFHFNEQETTLWNEHEAGIDEFRAFLEDGRRTGEIG